MISIVCEAGMGAYITCLGSPVTGAEIGATVTLHSSLRSRASEGSCPGPQGFCTLTGGKILGRLLRKEPSTGATRLADEVLLADEVCIFRSSSTRHAFRASSARWCRIWDVQLLHVPAGWHVPRQAPVLATRASMSNDR